MPLFSQNLLAIELQKFESSEARLKHSSSFLFVSLSFSKFNLQMIF